MLNLGEILRPLEKKTYLHHCFSCYLPSCRIPVRYCYTKFGKYLVCNLEQAEFQSAQLAFRSGMDRFVRNDGGCRGHCLGQRILSPLGKNRPLSFWVSIVAECYLEHRFLRAQGTLLGIGGDYNTYDAYCTNDSLVQGSKQGCCLAHGTLPAMGLFRHRFELQNLGTQLIGTAARSQSRLRPKQVPIVFASSYHF